ncbi:MULTISPECIES: HNH endonuclease signature motif containing protein [unclassified Rhodococcus (in: high G+C Gram-positive bacteria)]|uniref:HNH endonuclease signature motif containing protein n=1 Tax=unclassified Rhodococcus (in: high G+C Gram-positive bacteria) TaxID=192944 RepID=UPI00165D889D|nr:MULTISPECIES: HNH endonuclease signature motif containing protein [unclassified Rhodococcus (in: high G+C Gram-positive bacteria)]MDI9925300.1 DUF222 domain-containing protein [Rhodococcus sp. IEGM 1341]
MGAVPTVSLEALTAAAREENRQAARKITACYRVHCDWITRDTKHKHYSRYGRTEMSVALGCSATVAEAYVSVGVALHTRMPLLRAAFETGEIDLPRVRTVCRILDNLSDDIVTRVEAEIVEAARRSSPGPLEQAIWDILLRVAPEEAAALREFAKKFRTVTYSPAGELARIRAELTAPEAAAAWQLLEEMADTLCPKDPRGKKERLCDAFMARMHGEPRLACLCQRTDCPKTEATLPDRRVPLTMITVDIATLIGLLANPAYLAGHGSIDPDLARELARNSHWQILLTEAVTLAEKLGLAVQNPDTGEWERTPKNPTPETEEDTDPPTNTDPAASTASAASRTETRTDTASATDSETGCGTSTDTDATTAPETEPANESAASNDPATESTTAPSPTPASSPTSVTATTTSPSPTSVTATATAPAPATATDSASGPGTNPGRGSDAAQVPAPIAETAPNVASDTRSAATQHERSDTATAAPTDETSPAMEDGPSSPSADTSPHTADSRDNQRRPQSLTSAAALFCTHTPIGRGTRHSSALDLDDIRHPARNTRALDLRSAIRLNNPTTPTGHTPAHRTSSGLYLGSASLAAALEAAIAADPTLGTSVPRDPFTDRALIYRPDALTTAAVRLRDKHCRFPGCHRPAARCQLDHIVASDHANPRGGGWTTVNNLQCLCDYHHSVKTAGYWTAVMLPGGAILWTSTSKTTRITLPTNATSVPILGNDLRPHIPTTPKRSSHIAYPNPPDNHVPETEPPAEDTDTDTPPF